MRIVRRRGDLIISETRHGFICANAGIDLSNVALGTAALLPEDSDRSARRIRAGLRALLGVDVGVIISDTFGRTWRRGVTDVAIGCAGVAAVIDLRGTLDANGRELVATEVCVADELASAAELVMGKDRGIPAAIVRGVPDELAAPRLGAVRDRAPARRRPVPLEVSGQLLSGQLLFRPAAGARTPTRRGSRRPAWSMGAIRAESRPARCRDSSAAAHRAAEEPYTVCGSTPACSAMVA